MVAALKLQRSQNRSLRRRANRLDKQLRCGGESPAPPAKKAGPRQPRVLPPAGEITERGRKNRIFKMAHFMHRQLQRFTTAAERAEVVDEMLELQEQDFREELRGKGVVARERYLAVRDAIAYLKEHFWTAENWLELRILKYVPMSVFCMAHNLLSKKQDEHGLWHPAVLLKIPGKVWRARKDGIFSHLMVPSPCRNPHQLKKAHDVVLEPEAKHESISEDGKGVQFDALAMGAEAMKKARDTGNLHPPQAFPEKHYRLQFLCDAMGWLKGGRMITRAGVRCMMLKLCKNSTRFFTNCGLYLGDDKHSDLKNYLATTFDGLNSGFTKTDANTKDENEQTEYVSTSHVTLPGAAEDGGDMICEVCDGGDAASANASAGLEPPPSHQGCCHWCEGRRAEWFDWAKTKTAKRRTLIRSMLAAHMMPPGFPPGTKLKCPHCNIVVSEKEQAAREEQYASWSGNKQGAADLAHRKTHAGQHYLRGKLLHIDHVKRQVSLLHLILNATSTTLLVSITKGASIAQRAAINAVLERHRCEYRVKEKKSQREKKPNGNECRKLLWRPKLMIELIDARWGSEASSAAQAQAASISASQAKGCDAGLLPPGAMQTARTAPPPAPPKPAKPAPKRGAPKVAGFSAEAQAELDSAPVPTAAEVAAATSACAAHTAAAQSKRGVDAAAAAAAASPDDVEDDTDIDHLELSEDMPDLKGDVIGNRASALQVIDKLLVMMLELHEQWEEDTAAEREKRGAAAQLKGRAWANAMRAHTGNAHGFYYSHVAGAHLEELIREHGHLASGNDEILEAGNKDVKGDKSIGYKGGCSAANAPLLVAKRTRASGEGDELEEYLVTRKNNAGMEVAAGRNQRVREKLLAKRPCQALTKSRKEAIRLERKRKEREVVKAETVLEVSNAASRSLRPARVTGS